MSSERVPEGPDFDPEDGVESKPGGPEGPVSPDGLQAPYPEPDEALVENTVPHSEKVFVTRPFDPREHNARTRRALAFTSLAVLVVFDGVILGFFLGHLITLQELTTLMAVFAGLQTLAAGAFAYYYAKDN